MRAQAFSMDIMIAIVIFIGAIFLAYSFITSNQDNKGTELKEEAFIVLESLASEVPDIGILDGNEVNQAKLEALLGMEYSDIKERIRIENEFCLFLEDENGNVIYIESGKPGIGSEKIKISDDPCD